LEITVIKIGGSLAANPDKLRALCVKLSILSEDFGLVAVPGGGEFADAIRDADKRFALSPWASHRMAILGMDAYGFLLADITPISILADSAEKAKMGVAAKKRVIFLPSRLMLAEDPLENSWDVTSDSIAAYVAEKLHAKKILLLTDVDGVFSSDIKTHVDAKLISKISPELLAQEKRTSVDCYLAKLLLKSKIQCFVVNGNFPDRVEAVLKGQETVCTQIGN
jgi:5-(aminomethyl)-3-furanmethanol phosphate kinase